MSQFYGQRDIQVKNNCSFGRILRTAPLYDIIQL